MIKQSVKTVLPCFIKNNDSNQSNIEHAWEINFSFDYQDKFKPEFFEDSKGYIYQDPIIIMSVYTDKGYIQIKADLKTMIDDLSKPLKKSNWYQGINEHAIKHKEKYIIKTIELEKPINFLDRALKQQPPVSPTLIKIRPFYRLIFEKLFKGRQFEDSKWSSIDYFQDVIEAEKYISLLKVIHHDLNNVIIPI